MDYFTMSVIAIVCTAVINTLCIGICTVYIVLYLPAVRVLNEEPAVLKTVENVYMQ